LLERRGEDQCQQANRQSGQVALHFLSPPEIHKR
jgi:hypothetical protein